MVYNLDDETPSYEHHEHYEDENDADDDKSENDEEEDEGEVSDSGSSTPKASRQSFGLTSPPPAYVTTTTERPSTPRASRQMEGQGEGAYGSSPTLLPARAYSPPGENRWRRRQGHGHGHGMNESVSSMATIKPAKSEQEVLDAMIDDLSRTQREDDDAAQGVYERGLGLKPARSLRRERRQGRD